MTGWGGLTGAEFASIFHVQNVGVLTPLIYVVKAYGLYIQKYQGQTFVVAVGVGIVSGFWLRRQWFKLLGALHPQATSPAPVASPKSTA